MIGVPGTAHRLFGALRDHGISVILISQGSSEHSICFAIPEAEAARAETRRARRRSTASCAKGQIQSVEVDRRLQHPRRRRRRHGGLARRRRESVRRARQRRRQRSRDRAGRVGAQHLRRDRRQALVARAALGAFELLSVAAHGLDRADRARRRRQRAARPAGVAGRAPVARSQARPARARHHELEAHAPRRSGSAARALARCVRGRGEAADLDALRASTCTPIICRTRSSSIARRARTWPLAIRTGSRAAFTS